MDVVLDTIDRNDEQLAAEAAREGSDGPAFVQLLQRYQTKIWRVCFRLLGNEADAHDAAQEVFVQLFLQRAKFAGRSKYSTWAHGIALRVCLMTRRSLGRRRKRETIAQQQAAEHFEQQSTHSDLSMDLNRMLESLDEEERAILILKYAEGYSYDDLSEMFELSVSGCKMRVSRARKRLNELYPDQRIEDPEDERG
ncbi:MAG: RNA polymerase sigma-70 factor (ECF subfamily) [Pirellulaceae bacterium]